MSVSIRRARADRRETVRVADLEVDLAPVTNERYDRFVRTTGHRPPAFWVNGRMPPRLADHPVVGVDFFDAVAFALWAGGSLPTELEWAEASGLEEQRAYVWGDTFASHRCNTVRSGKRGTTPVGAHPAGTAPSGCVDLCGNVWEMTCSAYPGDPESVIVKGGSWYDFPGHARLDVRFRTRVHKCGNTVGFRLVYGRPLRLPPFLDKELVARCVAWRGGRGGASPGVVEQLPAEEEQPPPLDSLAMERALEIFDSVPLRTAPRPVSVAPIPSPERPNLWRRMQAFVVRHPQVLFLAMAAALLGAVGLVYAAVSHTQPGSRGDRPALVVAEPRPSPEPAPRAPLKARRVATRNSPVPSDASLESSLRTLAVGAPQQRDEAERHLLWQPEKARSLVERALGENPSAPARASLLYVRAALEEMEASPEPEPTLMDLPPRSGLVYFLERIDGQVAEEIAMVRRTARAENLRSAVVVLGEAHGPEIVQRYRGPLGEIHVYLDADRNLGRRWGVTRAPAVAGLRNDGRLAFVHIGHVARSRLAKRAAELAVDHVDDISFDFSREDYLRAVDALGGYDGLYCRYFDQQYELIETLNPAVIGHFDLIRIYDKHYKSRLAKTDIARRIDRNLALIADRGLILDFNLAALSRGMDEPYISAGILRKARDMGIAVVPGDDSHSADTVGRHMGQGTRLLKEAGFGTDWQRPV